MGNARVSVRAVCSKQAVIRFARRAGKVMVRIPVTGSGQTAIRFLPEEWAKLGITFLAAVR